MLSVMFDKDDRILLGVTHVFLPSKVNPGLSKWANDLKRNCKGSGSPSLKRICHACS